MDDEQRWTKLRRRGAPNATQQHVVKPVLEPKAPARSYWTTADLDAPAPPLPEKWKNWLGTAQS
jgi:hypothetical protein